MMAAVAQTVGDWPAKIGVGLLAVIAGAFLLDRLGLWMEKRGWVYWRKRKPSGGGGGATAGLLNEFQKLVEPQIEHRQQVMEERNESIGQRLGRGDDLNPPKKGADNDDKKEFVP